MKVLFLTSTLSRDRERNYITRMGRKIIYAFGTALFVASLVFIADFASRNLYAVREVKIYSPSLLSISVLIYGLSHISSSLSWTTALRQMGISMPLALGIRISLVAQIGKYLPGNLAHYVGRAAIARASGVSITTSGISTAVELVSAILAAGLVVSIALLIDPTPITFVHQQIVETKAAVTALAALLFGTTGVMIWIGRKGYGVTVLLYPAAFLSLNFVLSSASFYVLLRAFGAEFSISEVIAAFVVAWVIGFFVPGAPAGFGVREAILIAFLSPAMGGATALVCTIIHRLITACVDALAASVGYAWLTFANRRSSFVSHYSFTRAGREADK